MNARFLSSILEIDSAKWDKLVPQNYPFAKHGFLAALEKSGCVGGNSGWSPQHLLIEEGSDLIAAIPAYQKSHSYGEYVFDSQWAGAFERYGKQYYPKLLTAIPFTPATGPRILTKPETHLETVWPVMRNAIDIKPDSIYSSWHILFVDSATKTFLAKDPDILAREDIQFHWYNRVPATEDDSNKEDSTSRHFRHFDQFLSGFRSSKRKQIKRERRKVAEQNLTLIRRTGTEISEKHWEEFYHCYQMTYLKRSGHTGYLNKAFFQLIADTMANQCMLVSAYQQHNTEEKEERQHDLAACSLFFFDDQNLYGRYWGALANFDCLHFEACYYQGIEFAIERGLMKFDPGTQGEHKLVRGFEPTKTHSYHWVGDQNFARAIDDFLQRERQHTQAYQESANHYLPFRKDKEN